MPNNLQSFFLKTLRPRLNDPKNAKFWLPKLLRDMQQDGKPVLPLKIDSQDIGTLSGDAGNQIAQNIAEGWGAQNDSFAIPDPAAPLPSLTLSDMIISGLDNVAMGASTSTPTPSGSGYATSAVLEFNHDATLDTLEIAGSFHLTQAICSCESPGATTCDGKVKTTIDGIGTFRAALPTCDVDADFDATVAGQDATRALAVTLNALRLRGKTESSQPVFQIKDVTVTNTDQTWINAAAKEALNSGEAADSLISSLQAALNTADNRDQFSNMLTSVLTGAMNDVFSDLPAAGLPTDGAGQTAATAVDLYLFDRMRAAVVTPASNWYLPWQVASSANPLLDPYTADSIDIPKQVIGGLTYTDISLTDVTITNTANVIAPAENFVLDTPLVNTVLVLGTQAAGPARTFERAGTSVTMDIPPSPPLVLRGQFTFTQVGFQSVTLTGTTVIHVTNARLETQVQPSGTDASTLVLTVKRFALDLSQADLAITVTLDPPDDTLSQIAETILKKPETVAKVAEGLNQQLTGQLDQLGDEFSKVARTAIDQQLSG